MGSTVRAAMMGDNCIDEYPRLGRGYPTGNVVDTGLNLRRLGAQVSILSTTGSDEAGSRMRETLSSEGLDVTRLKTGEGATAVTIMDMDGLDRVHGDYSEGVLATMTFDEDDIAFAASYDIVHTALWGKAESALPRLKELGATVSFDYADRLSHPLVESTLPFVDYGFFSYHEGRNDFIEGFLRDKVARGMRLAVATFGEDGSLCWDGNRFHACGIVPAKVVNTVGAGDAYIAGFLFGILSGQPVDGSMALGARVAADVVGVFEPWLSGGSL